MADKEIPLSPAEMLEKAKELAQLYRVKDGKGCKLKDFDPGNTAWLKDEQKQRSKEVLQHGIAHLAKLQELLYAQDRCSVLLIFQAMDAAGKDGAIAHVMSGVNPQGCQVFSFKAPTSTDLDHDFMWRCMNCLPERGRIGIFNRSYYEETLVVRVHPEWLDKQRLPPKLVTKNIWDERFEDIRNIEKYLTRNGTTVIKFFLNVSKAEQKKRFISRIDETEKNWKFSVNDVKERQHWDAYMHAYEETIRNTATKEAPWYVVPADNKWFTRIVVAAVVIATIHKLDLSVPTVDDAKRAELKEIKRMLQSEPNER
jgi:PPK2 family polyphosphate:nucleotide phosphotransferase